MAKPGADLAPTPQTGTSKQTRQRRGAVSPHPSDPVEPRPVEPNDYRNRIKGLEYVRAADLVKVK